MYSEQNALHIDDILNRKILIIRSDITSSLHVTSWRARFVLQWVSTDRKWYFFIISSWCETFLQVTCLDDSKRQLVNLTRTVVSICIDQVCPENMDLVILIELILNANLIQISSVFLWPWLFPNTDRKE